MKILFWSDLYLPQPGGIEQVTCDLAQSFLARGHQTAVICSHSDEPLPDLVVAGGVPVYRFHARSALGANDMRQVARILAAVSSVKKSFQPDLLHLQIPAATALFDLQTASAWKCPRVVTVHGTLRKCQAGQDTLLGSIFERCAWVTAVSERLLEDVHALAPGTRGKSSCIYNGRALPELPEEQVRPQTVVLGCGRQVEDKGFDVLIHAFARLAARVPEATLVLAGDGPERPHLEQQARTLGVLDRVTFPGWLSESALQQQMARSTILVVPSRWREGCALVVLEAAMQGLPVLASNVGSLPELIDPERTGVLVPPEDASALSEALVSLLQSPERRRRIADAARAAARERFSLPRMIDQYEAIYEQLVPPTASLAESRLSYAASL